MSDGRLVYLPYKSELMELRDRGFGELREGKLLLSSYESFYLIEKQKIRVFDQEEQPGVRASRPGPQIFSWKTGNLDKVLGLQGPAGPRLHSSRVHQGFRFRHLRKRAATASNLDRLRRWRGELEETGRTSQYSDKEKKELILAVVDRRTDIVYYTLSSLKV